MVLIVFHCFLLVCFIQICKFTGYCDVDFCGLKLFHPFRAEFLLDCMVSFHLCSRHSDCLPHHVSCFAFQLCEFSQAFYDFFCLKSFFHLLPVRFFSEPVRLDNCQLFQKLRCLMVFFAILQKHFSCVVLNCRVFAVNFSKFLMSFLYKHSATHCSAVSGNYVIFSVYILDQDILHYPEQLNGIFQAPEPVRVCPVEIFFRRDKFEYVSVYGIACIFLLHLLRTFVHHIGKVKSHQSSPPSFAHFMHTAVMYSFTRSS